MRLAAALLCAVGLVPASASAQAASAPAAAPASAVSVPGPATPPGAADQAADQSTKLEAQRRDTIRFGIDSEIGDLVNSLGSEKDGRYNDDLLGLLKTSRSAKLRASVLDFLASLEWKGAEDFALGIMNDRDNADPDLVASALSYLAAIRSKEALKLSDALVKEDNKKLLPALVRLMGRSGGEAEEKTLLDWFNGDSTTPALKEEAIKALGEIGSAKAAERLGKFVEDGAGGKAARMFACAALAKIKDQASVAPLVKAANDADPNVRTSAIEALGAFSEAPASFGEEARGALVQALRDSFPKARIAACKAVAVGNVGEALPFLKYKARSDPERAVKIEALRSLALMGASFDFLRERLADKRESPELRSLCFGLLARYDPSGSMAALESTLKSEAAEKERSFYTSLAREIANADKAPSIGALARVLLADQEYLIRIAGIEWIRKNKAQDLKADLESLAKGDDSDMIRKRAADALKAF
jgi:HEAT repeat protein